MKSHSLFTVVNLEANSNMWRHEHTCSGMSMPKLKLTDLSKLDLQLFVCLVGAIGLKTKPSNVHWFYSHRQRATDDRKKKTLLHEFTFHSECKPPSTVDIRLMKGLERCQQIFTLTLCPFPEKKPQMGHIFLKNPGALSGHQQIKNVEMFLLTVLQIPLISRILQKLRIFSTT